AYFGEIADSWKSKALGAWQAAVAADAGRSLFRVTMTTSMMAAAIVLWSAGSASPGDIVLVLTAFFIIGGYLRDIGQHIAHLQRSLSDMEEVVLFWMRDDDVADAPGAAPLVIAPSSRADLI